MKRLPFTPEMFLAWRQGRKTVTRRLINPQPESVHFSPQACRDYDYLNEHGCLIKPHYRPGERVLVVTRWAVHMAYDGDRPAEISSAAAIWIAHSAIWDECGKWRPGRFVPLHLEHHFPQTTILSVRPERLQDITEEDAMKEGMIPIPGGVDYVWSGMPYKSEFATTWNRIHGPNAFSANPMVWRYEIAPPGDDWRIG